MIAFDLDDTLAATEFENAAIRGLVNVFKSAKVIYTPNEPFYVITGRPHATAEQKQATEQWLRDNFPGTYKGTFYVSGNEAEIVKAKAAKIREHRVTSYTDNNRNFLRAISAELPNFPLYTMNADGTRESFNP